VDREQAGLVGVRGGRVGLEFVYPVIEGVRRDAFRLTKSDDGGAGVGEALQSFDSQLARFGARADGTLFGLGHDGTPEDRATPPKIIRLSMT
jgi:hypothetical protein